MVTSTAKATSLRVLRQTVQQVQVAFPQIYLACHTRHQRKRSTQHRLSARDASILAHLDRSAAITPSQLAIHLGVARSTLSEALKRLHALGFVTSGDARNASRRTSVLLTDAGSAAISDTSVLETPLLLRALAGAPPAELRAIARGLNLLALRCRDGKLRERQTHRDRSE